MWSGAVRGKAPRVSQSAVAPAGIFHVDPDRQGQQRACSRGSLALATSTSLVTTGPTPAFVLSRVFAADGAGVASFVRFQQPGRPAYSC
jgi:hypothetical protein